MGIVEFARVQCDGCGEWLRPSAEETVGYEAVLPHTFETPTQAERHAIREHDWRRDEVNWQAYMICPECQDRAADLRDLLRLGTE